VLRSSVLTPLLLLVIAADPTTIVNSILSGYGLPTLRPDGEFADEFS
jgi:hypothetical protein